MNSAIEKWYQLLKEIVLKAPTNVVFGGKHTLKYGQDVPLESCLVFDPKGWQILHLGADFVDGLGMKPTQVVSMSLLSHIFPEIKQYLTDNKLPGPQTLRLVDA